MFKYVLLIVCLAHVSFQRNVFIEEESTTVIEDTTVEIVTTDEPSTSENPTDPRCPDHDGSTPTYIAHDVNCWQYYECSNGYLNELTCPPGTYFNVKLDVCDAPGNVKCGDLQTTAGVPVTTESL